MAKGKEDDDGTACDCEECTEVCDGCGRPMTGEEEADGPEAEYDLRKLFGKAAVNDELFELVGAAVSYGDSQYAEGLLEGIRALNDVLALVPTGKPFEPIRECLVGRINSIREALGLGPAPVDPS